MKRDAGSTLRDIVYGAAVGDALGVPFEGEARDTFTCTGMTHSRRFKMPAGSFSDDTSMMLALCDSLRARKGRIDVDDIRERFRMWLFDEAYTPDGFAFGMGTTCSIALNEGHGLSGERDNGNGSLMRTLPLAVADVSDEEIEAVSAITHAHPISREACVVAVHIARDLADGIPVEQAISQAKPSHRALSHVPHVLELERDDIQSGGYVVSTLEAALWCLGKTANFEECVLTAVNLGGDADTTACVAGAFAGIVYGRATIPREWLNTLRAKSLIESCLFA